MNNGKPFCWHSFINVDEPTAGGCVSAGFFISGSSDTFSGPLLEPCSNNHGNDGLFDNFSAEEGRHNLSFGVNTLRRWMSLACYAPSEAVTIFTGQYTNFALADFLLGDIGEYLQGAGAFGTYTGWQLGLYAEDQFRYRPNLTLELGLRWDPSFPLAPGLGRGATFVPGQQSTVYPNAPTGLVFPGDKGIGPGLARTHLWVLAAACGFLMAASCTTAHIYPRRFSGCLQRPRLNRTMTTRRTIVLSRLRLP